MREAHKFCAPVADAAITLSCPGPAPLWDGDKDETNLAPRQQGSHF